MIYLNQNGRYHSGKTTDALKEQFLELLPEKSVDRISVSELCRRLEINRSTFYAHYTDIYDLMDDVKEDLLREIDTLSSRILQDEHWTADQVTREIFALIYQNRVLLRYEFILGSDLPFWNIVNGRVQKLFCETLFQRYPEFTAIDKMELENALLFLSYGYYAIYARWLRENCCTKLEDMTKIALKLTTNCIEAFETSCKEQDHLK